MLLLNSLRTHSKLVAFSCERNCWFNKRSITTSNTTVVSSSSGRDSTRRVASSAVVDSFSINPSREYKSIGCSFVHHQKKKLLFVVGTTSTNNFGRRSMSTSAVNLKLLKQYDNIVKSGQDGRLYRGLLLDNGLKCLIVSDPSTDRSAASLDVHAGYLLDPPKFPGLAHFLEHMLFMGSKKYPTENTFAKFIDDHAGMTNAYTATENTNYHFEVATTHFKEALDIFAQFFISPLFDPSSTERELNAVDSENQKNLQSDAWRIDQLEKSTCVPEHPYSKFGTGNLSTLKTEPEKEGLNVREELLKFHSNYYSANLMTLCLVGKESLDELQQYAVDMFSDIPNKNLSPNEFDSCPFGKDFTSTIKKVVPVKDLKSMSLTWCTPDYRDHYKSNPGSYLSHLIGHEGKGSLLSELKKRGWVNSLYAGPRREGRGFQFFNLVLDLSDEGDENIDSIVSLIYQYLNMLKGQKPAQWVFDEVTNLGKIGFEFKDKETPMRLVSSVAADLHTYSFEDILSAPYYATKFEPDLIESLSTYLRPDKMRLTLISKKYEGKTDQKEKWYGTDYSQVEMSEAQIKSLSNIGSSDAFNLPPKNAYVPEDLSLVEHVDGTGNLPTPKVIHSTPLTRLWFKDDAKFKLPKAIIKLELRNPLINLDPIHYNMASMFEQLLLDSLNEHLYSAELAGLHYKVDTNNYGLVVTFSGFSDKINVLVETIFDKMANFKVDPIRFNILKESYKRELTNFEADQPYRHSMYYMTLLVAEKGWSKSQLLNSLDDFTVDELQAFIPKVLTKGMFIESIAYGNITQKRAIELLNLVESKLKSINNSVVKPLEKYHQKNLRQYELKAGSSFLYMKNNNVHKTTSIEVYYQCGVQNNRNNALVQLFCQVINESAFNVLRTKEQLGYIVASGVRNFGGAQGCKMIIQSDRTPAYLDERIESFLTQTKESLASMSDDEFKQHVDALILNKLEEPKKMSRQADIYWSEIASHQYHFDREQTEVEEIKKLTKSDLIEFMQNHIEESDKRRKLAVYVHPAEMNEQMPKDGLKAELIEDMHEWQSQLPLFPLVKPYTTV